MSRFLALLFLPVMLVAPDALSQVSSERPPAPAVAPAAEATYDTGYLLAAYMAQLASAGKPPTQADIDEAAQMYLTNGAAVTGVPTSGPQASYFQNGAEATSVPTSGPGATYFQNGAAATAYPMATASAATAYATPTSAATADTAATQTSAAMSSSTATPAPASTAEPPSEDGTTQEAPPAPPPPPPSGASTESGLTCSPGELQAAMAFANQFATPAIAAPPPAPEQPAARPPASVSTGTSAAEAAASLFAASPNLTCPAAPSAVWRFLPAILGAILGGLAVALWTRPRAFRVPLRTRTRL